MESVIRPKVNLRKPEIMRSITPLHISDEIYPNETDEGYVESREQEKIKVSKVIVYEKGIAGCFVPEYTYSTALLLKEMLIKGDKYILKQLFQRDSILTTAIKIQDNKIYLQTASRDGKVKRISSTLLDDIQLFIEYIRHPNSTFTGLCWLLEEKLLDLRCQENFYNDWVKFLNMIETNDTAELETYILEGRDSEIGYDFHNWLYRMVSLEGIIHRNLASFIFEDISKVVYKGLYELLKREKEFKVNPLFLFVLQNFYMDIPENVELKNEEFGYNNVMLCSLRADLEAVGRSSKLVKRFVPKISKIVRKIEKSSNGLYVAVGSTMLLALGMTMSGIVVGAEIPLIAISFATSIGVGCVGGGIASVNMYADYKKTKRALAYRIGGLQLFAEQHPTLSIDDRLLLKG